MGEDMIDLFNTNVFNADKYVKDLSQNCIGGQELILVRKQIHLLLETTNENLKKNVYQNYMQFIETAKEISHLESEMYQLSHLLTEQKTLLNALCNTSILGDEENARVDDENHTNEEQSEDHKDDVRRQKISAVLEKVEGCSGILDLPNIALLHEGFLAELDINVNRPINSVYGFLFSEGLLLAVTNSGIGSKRYKKEAYFELGSLAVVNVRDLGNIKHAFKVLAFPDTRLFQCKSNSLKKEWLDKFDQAKKARLSNEQGKRESNCEKSPSRSSSIDTAVNPFNEVEDEAVTHPEWLFDVSEELDVYIAQRHFEDALVLLQKTNTYVNQFNSNHTDHVIVETQRKVDQKTMTLIEILMKELEVSPDKSLQGGLRAARRAVRLLNQLDRKTQCCDLFLKLCSSTLKTQYKRVKREGSTNIYIRYLASVVFTNMSHMTEEFLRAFPDSSTCSSAYIVWASNELSLFISHFIKQVFVPQTPLNVLTECVVTVKLHCEKLCKYGVDLCYQLDGALRLPLSKTLRDAKDKLIEVIKIRSNEEKWIPTNLKSKVSLTKFLQENNEIGLDLRPFITGDYWIQLTGNTISFSKLYLSLLEDCLKLHTAELLYTIDNTLHDVFYQQITNMEQAFNKESSIEQKQFIIKNVNFLLETVLNVTQTKYENVFNFECEKLKSSKKDFSALQNGIAPSKRKGSNY